MIFYPLLPIYSLTGRKGTKSIVFLRIQLNSQNEKQIIPVIGHHTGSAVISTCLCAGI